MLSIPFEEYCYLLPLLLGLVFQWFFFLKNNFFTVKTKPTHTDKIINKKIIKKLVFKNYVYWNSLSLIFLFISFFIFFGIQQNFFWNHFKITNFNLNIILFLLFISFCLNIFIRFIPKINLNYSIDYFFILGNLFIFLLFIFYTNTLYTFLFILELNSSFIFYKFIVSKFWFKNSNKKNNLTSTSPKYYLNMLFFQYWVTFFSSVLILYSIINILFLFGSSEWLLIEFLTQTNFNFLMFENWFFFIIIWFSFFVGFFLKIGLTPLHLFKIEVYKGIPFISIFFYTTYYFLVFFLFFVILLISYFYTVLNYIWFFFCLFIVFGGFYIVILLFDINFLKAFFSYSTIINTYSLLCLVLSFV